MLTLSIPQTSPCLLPAAPSRGAGSPICEHASLLFSAAGPSAPVLSQSRAAAEFDVGRDSRKFVAGWACVTMLGGSVEVPAAEQRIHPAAFFTAANPTDKATRDLYLKAYQHHSHDSQSVRQEIGRTALAQVLEQAQQLDLQVPLEDVKLRQGYRIDAVTGQGVPYLHPRDVDFSAALEAADSSIHTFLPGYATGDRYSLILAMLINPKLNVSIAYSRGNQAEQAHAREAFEVIRTALTASRQADAADRVSLYEHTGKSLKDARESLDDSATRADFRHVEGADSPLAGDAEHQGTHVFHISATTELIARRFREPDMSPEDRCIDVRNKLIALVDPAERTRIDALVDTVIAEQGIQPGAAALWIADREYANAREAEAISRPMMFEQIADALGPDKTGAAGTRVYCIADTYINRARDENGEDRLTDRHPYRPQLHPHVGRFWAAELNGERVLAPREHQWYFMHKLLDTVGGPVIGIRSGALEPFALMGHQVIYLEHHDMFTPDRHACWQGVIPYHRLITHHTTGYRNKESETYRGNELRSLLSETLQRRFNLGAAEPVHGPWPDRQQSLSRMGDDLSSGILSGNELKLLVAMTQSRSTAAQTAALPGTFSAAPRTR
ncbi:hypothetical protein ICJ04_13540 [Stenotrophomonas sp. 169]|uniref:hypothetical protein n=1 Tax=Stenotrophomonas sp. 169 TaxID=2770322 RepID=UPI0016624340|nr:hypothetical protein [Stenotrophomonas sp. 169]QNR96530.1 hypothetical protein ICJ04_13540 [Stenotrophomonas sp. 169]